MKPSVILTLLLTALVGCDVTTHKSQSYVITETVQRNSDDFDFIVTDKYQCTATATADGVLATVPAPVDVAPKSQKHNQPVLKLHKPKLKVTVYTMDSCQPCHALQKKWGNGNDRVEVEYIQAKPAQGPAETYPTIRWTDNAGLVRWPIDARTGQTAVPGTLTELVDIIERTNEATKVQGGVLQPTPTIKFGYEVWTENATGRTSVHHLMEEHGLAYAQLAPYVNNQHALNLIHGWKHTGRGYTPANQPSVQVKSQEEPRMEASGVGGTVEGAADWITGGLEWIRTNVGEDVKMTVEWNRTGAYTFPLLKNADWSALKLYGKMGHFKASAESSQFPINSLGFAYAVSGDDLILTVDPVKLEGYVLKLNPKSQNAMSQRVGFVDPASLLTVFSVMRGIWQILHPTADLTLGGNISATGVLHGNTLTVDFNDDFPKIKLSMLFTFNLGVKRVEITPQAIRILFNGSRWIKERTFKVTRGRMLRLNKHPRDCLIASVAV